MPSNDSIKLRPIMYPVVSEEDLPHAQAYVDRYEYKKIYDSLSKFKILSEKTYVYKEYALNDESKILFEEYETGPEIGDVLNIVTSGLSFVAAIITCFNIYNEKKKLEKELEKMKREESCISEPAAAIRIEKHTGHDLHVVTTITLPLSKNFDAENYLKSLNLSASA